jgi:hypothetical protein
MERDMAGDQLVLTDETLRVLYTLLPYGRPVEQLARARNSYDGGHLTATEVHLLADTLARAEHDPRRLVTSQALRRAREQFGSQLAAIDLGAFENQRGCEVSVFVWDVLRDGPLGETVHSPVSQMRVCQAVAEAAARPAIRPENRQPPRNVPSSAR